MRERRVEKKLQEKKTNEGRADGLTIRNARDAAGGTEGGRPLLGRRFPPPPNEAKCYAGTDTTPP